jgi:hypothetical protein
MQKFKVKIVQVFKATREVVVDVEAEDMERAVEALESGDLDGPSFDDPRWKTGWDLQNEEITPCKD